METACSFSKNIRPASLSSPMRLPPPKTSAHLVSTAMLMLLLRVPFARLPVIPYCVEFNPAIALIPLLGALWGLPAALGAALGQFTGDLLLGELSGLTGFKTLGVFLMALSAWMLWNSRSMGSRPRRHARSWGHTLRFLAISIPGTAAAAAWTGLGANLMRIYPASYVMELTLIHHLYFQLLAGGFFYQQAAEKLGYDPRIKPPPAFRKRAMLMILIGGPGACAIAWFTDAQFYHSGLLSVHTFGETSGPLTPWFMLLFLLVHGSGLLFWVRR